jgi:integrase
VWLCWLTVGEVGRTKRKAVAMANLPPHGSCDCTTAAPCTVRAAATAEVRRYAARAVGAVLEDVGEPVGEWFGRLHDAKEAKGLLTVGDMRGRFRRWVAPLWAGKSMQSLTREDVEAVVRGLDVAVAAFQKQGPGKGRLSPSTATNVWGDLQHALDEACSAKDPALRVLTTSPAANVRGPETGSDREGAILYSDEILALLSGRSVVAGRPDVPLYRRQAYAVALYTAARASELEALTADDVDLVHDTVSISKQADRTAKSHDGPRLATRQTKTKRTRTVDIEAHVRPLLEALCKAPAGKGGRLLHMPPPEDRAELLRQDLATVGVTRAALFVEGDPQRRAVVFHDLRDTSLTHRAVRGDSPIVIQWAGGHTDFKTTQGYIDRGRVEARRIGAPLPPLPPEVLPASAIEPQFLRLPSPKLPKNKAFLRPQRELNPRSPIGSDGQKALEKKAQADASRMAGAEAIASQPMGDAQLGPSDADLERAIVSAMLDGRGAVAEMLTETLKARRLAAAGVVQLPSRAKGGRP